MNRKWIISFCGLILVACSIKEENKIPYEFLVFRDDNVKMWSDTIPLSEKGVIENSDFKLDDENGNRICEGKFNNGLRVGEWKYHPTTGETIILQWAKYSNEYHQLEVNYPKNWKTHDDPDRPFQATFPLKANEREKGKYFIILSQKKDSIKMTLKEYQDYYKKQTFATENVKEYAHFVLESASGKTFYFMRYIVVRENEELLVLSFIGDKGSENIYDVTYSSINEDYNERHIMFFDMIRSLKIGGERLFST